MTIYRLLIFVTICWNFRSLFALFFCFIIHVNIWWSLLIFFLYRILLNFFNWLLFVRKFFLLRCYRLFPLCFLLGFNLFLRFLYFIFVYCFVFVIFLFYLVADDYWLFYNLSFNLLELKILCNLNLGSLLQNRCFLILLFFIFQRRLLILAF